MFGNSNESQAPIGNGNGEEERDEGEDAAPEGVGDGQGEDARNVDVEDPAPDATEGVDCKVGKLEGVGVVALGAGERREGKGMLGGVRERERGGVLEGVVEGDTEVAWR